MPKPIHEMINISPTDNEIKFYTEVIDECLADVLNIYYMSNRSTYTVSVPLLIPVRFRARITGEYFMVGWREVSFMLGEVEGTTIIEFTK